MCEFASFVNFNFTSCVGTVVSLGENGDFRAVQEIHDRDVLDGNSGSDGF